MSAAARRSSGPHPPPSLLASKTNSRSIEVGRRQIGKAIALRLLKFYKDNIGMAPGFSVTGVILLQLCVKSK